MPYRIPAWIEIDTEDQEEAEQIADALANEGYLSLDEDIHPSWICDRVSVDTTSLTPSSDVEHITN